MSNRESPTIVRLRRGESLVELVVALLLLELVGAGALAAALSAERLGRRAHQEAAADAARWAAYRAAEVAAVCTEATAPSAISLPLAETATRPLLLTTLRCGR